MTELYRLEQVVRRYHEPGGKVREALRLSSLEVATGEILAVVGPNGSGKSTLLELLALLERPDEGVLRLGGRDPWSAGAGTLLADRRRLVLLLQRTVLFRAPVVDNVMVGLRFRGVPRREARQHALAVLEHLGLADLADRGSRELSGGEKQRVALARALVLEPEVLLLDEPTAHVDEASERTIWEVVQERHRKTGLTVILTSHHLPQVSRWATRTIALDRGRIAAPVSHDG